MGATAAQVARLRRMVNEPTTATYSDASIEEVIERYPVRDVRGVDWLDYDYTTTPPTATENANWMPTYDLYSAGAEIWQEKAAAVACAYATSADGVSLSRNQMYEQYLKQAAWCKSRAVPGCKKFIRQDIYRDTETGNIVQSDTLMVNDVAEDESN